MDDIQYSPKTAPKILSALDGKKFSQIIEIKSAWRRCDSGNC